MDLGIGGISQATQIGSGASAVVYRAHQDDLGRDVAIKVIPTDDEEIVKRFEREAKTMGRLSQNSGVVTVHGVGKTTGGQPYLILELCGSSLLDRIKSEGPLPVGEACSIITEVASAVESAHQLDVVHRDIKPANVLMGLDGKHKVADFGISTVTGATASSQGAGGFTASYAAPEVIESRSAGPAADVYSLGATLFHLVTGRPPFVSGDDNETLIAVLSRIVNEPVEDLRPLGFSDEVCSVIESAMAKDPEARPTTAQLAQSLERLAKPDDEPGFRLAAKTVGGSSGDGSAGANHAASSGVADLIDTTTEPLGAGAADQGQPALGIAGPALLAESVRGYRPTVTENRFDSTPMWVLVGVPGLIAAVIAGALWFAFTSDGDGSTSASGDHPAGPQVASASSEDDQDGASRSNKANAASSTSSSTTSTTTSTAPPPTIPSAAGLSEDEAIELFERENVAYDIERHFDQSVPPGEVISLSPAGGQPVEAGQTVIIKISIGVGPKVPDVAGLSADQARAALDEAGFTTVIREQTSETVPEGQVINTEPAAPDRAPLGSEVTVLLSTGPPCAGVFVPATAGTERAQAEQTLAAAELQSSARSVPNGDVAAGVVLASEPAPDTCVDRGSTVALSVSCGAPVAVPDPAGLSGADLSPIEALGLVVAVDRVVDSPQPRDTILALTPGPGTAVCTGSTVTVTLAGPACDIVLPEAIGRRATVVGPELAALGLRYAIYRRLSFVQPSGYVTYMAPVAGTSVCPNDLINLTVAR